MTLEERCQAIELILSDVDGVLTDGRIVLNNQGIETKLFHIRDGMISLRSSQIVKMRAAELEIGIVRQGTHDKLATSLEIVAQLGLTPQQVCYIGDDLPDLPVVSAVGLGVAVADAVGELTEAAAYVTKAPGGCGAVREIIELVLKAQGRWDDVIQAYR
jgi:YrbI family 3-deoxy-D-manno-octulosonate 8-phosphate phosphatase